MQGYVKKLINISIEQLQELKALVVTLNESRGLKLNVSDLIRQAIFEYCKKLKDELKQKHLKKKLGLI